MPELKSLKYARQHWIPLRDTGKPVNQSTLWRWNRRGVAGVKLRFRYIGGQPRLAREDVEEFFSLVEAAKCSAVADPTTDEQLRDCGLL